MQCWGVNFSGELGDGTTTARLTPAPVTYANGAPLTNVTAISAGTYHTCALLSDTTAVCWGDNGANGQAFGQLGDPASVGSYRANPVAVSGLTGATRISAGYGHTCALLSNTTVKCWGSNYLGELGDGTTHERDTPVTVSGLIGATSISTQGFRFTCASLIDGTVKCWGFNDAGQLGNGTKTNSSVPVLVSGINTAKSVAIGQSHACAVLADTTVQCWGGNGYGELGSGTTVSSTVPVPVSGLSTVVAVAPGLAHTCALLNDGTVDCWGFNEFGQLGTGSTFPSFRSTPAATSALGRAAWTSSDTDIAFTDAWAGAAVSVKPGTTTITATYGPLSASTTLSVGSFAPEITVPSNFAISEDTPGGLKGTVPFKVTATGSPTPAITCTIPGPTTITSPYAFPLGETTVTCTALNSLGSDTKSFTVTITARAPKPPDVRIAKAILGGRGPETEVTVFNGDVVTFQLDVTNLGRGPTTDLVAVTDRLDPNLVFVAAGSDGRCSFALGVVTCLRINPLAPGADDTFRIVTRVEDQAAGFDHSIVIGNQAVVDTPLDDTPSNDKSNLVNVTVIGPKSPDLRIEKRIVGPRGGETAVDVGTGDVVTFQVDVTNAGRGPTTDSIAVADRLDPNLVFVAAGSDGRCSFAFGVVTCLRSNPLAPGVEDTFRIVTRVAANAASFNESLLISNQAVVDTSHDSFPPDNKSNVVTVNVYGPKPPNVRAFKVIQSPMPVNGEFPVVVGDRVTYLLGATNQGASPQIGATVGSTVVTDALDPLLQFVSGDGRCSIVGQLVTCTEPQPLNPGQSTSFQVVVAVGQPTNPAQQATIDVVNVANATTQGNAAADSHSPPAVVRLRVGAPTPTGLKVGVQPTDLNFVPQPVQVFFAEVARAGATLAIPIPPPPVPSGFRVAGQFYDISTTAVFNTKITPPITVCFTGTFGAKDSIFHFENGVLIDVTVARSPTQLCGATSSLSPFGVLRPDGPAAQLTDLVALVNSLGLKAGRGQSLVAKLQNALSAINTGRSSAACGMLGAFVAEVEAQTGKAIAPNEATQLLVAARQIQVLIGCNQ